MTVRSQTHGQTAEVARVEGVKTTENKIHWPRCTVPQGLFEGRKKGYDLLLYLGDSPRHRYLAGSRCSITNIFVSSKPKSKRFQNFVRDLSRTDLNIKKSKKTNSRYHAPLSEIQHGTEAK